MSAVRLHPRFLDLRLLEFLEKLARAVDLLFETLTVLLNEYAHYEYTEDAEIFFGPTVASADSEKQPLVPDGPIPSTTSRMFGGEFCMV